MNFERNSTHLNYFLPKLVDVKVFVFSENNIPLFSLNDALQGKYNENYLLIFYKGEIKFTDISRTELLSTVRRSSGICWLDNFNRGTVGRSSIIDVKNNTVGLFKNVGMGIIAPNIGITNGGITGTIKLDVNTNQIIINPPPSRFYLLDVHGEEANIGSIQISLTNADIKLKNHSFATSNNVGSMSFQVLKKGSNNLPQPISPFFVDAVNNPDNPRTILVSYFDKADLNKNSTIFITLKPFKEVSNKPDGFSSFMETVIQNSTFTNFSNERGQQYCIKVEPGKPIKISSRIATIELNIGDTDTKQFYFIPQEKESLRLSANVGAISQIMSGFSGTESLSTSQPQNNIQLTFEESNEVSIDKRAGLMKSHGDSVTSIVSFENINFNLDSEKAPIFENNGLEPNYKFIPKATQTTSTEFPIIPTFTFAGNEDFIEFEEVFKKVRLKKFSIKRRGSKLLKADANYITPQGFLKSGNKYSFVSNSGAGLNVSAKFSLEDKGTDLDLSLRKDEIFLVLTPKLFQSYGAAEVNARFPINRSSKPEDLFQIDIKTILNNTNLPDGHDSVVIFKFRNGKTDDLLKDINKWSNNGDILGNREALNTIAQTIEKKELTKFDDDYFNSSVLNDPNWQGIIILNFPIADAKDLPEVFTGLAASQQLTSSSKRVVGRSATEKLNLDTELRFKYIAFPRNKTKANESKTKVEIADSSFFGLIDYDPFNNEKDYQKIANHFDNTGWKFILSKLKVSFFNSCISEFKSIAFLQVKELFEESVQIGMIPLKNDTAFPHPVQEKLNLIRLDGAYNKNSNDNGEFSFTATLAGKITFSNPANLLRSINVTKIKFGYSTEANHFRFDIDAKAVINTQGLQGELNNILSIEELTFSNIGLAFELGTSLPNIKFDLSKLFVLPKIDFNGKDFLSSFPIRFSHFNCFKLTKISDIKIDIEGYDFFKFPRIKIPNIGANTSTTLFSFIFDLDVGTLGNLDGLKALKAQIHIGWTAKGGFIMGLKLNGPSSGSFHLDLFGALKLDIEKWELCTFKQADGSQQFVIRLIDTRLTILGIKLPPKQDNSQDKLSAMLFAQPNSKVAWLISYISVKGNEELLTLGVGQRVGIGNLNEIKDVSTAMGKIKQVFDPKFDLCNSQQFPNEIYKPTNNWLVASENVIPPDWKSVIDLKFVFNDPVLYGVFLRLVGVVDIDILYKKLADNLGVWSLEVVLDPSIRNIEAGGIAILLPNIGIDLFTNGDWRLDVGFPRNTDDWSRSCLIQLRPFVGWAGFYVSRLRTASLSVFSKYQKELPGEGKGCNIIQAGFAFRIGIGAYIDKGIFYVGASISVFGIMEGALAFNKERGSTLSQIFPDHFALSGRIGAIAEVIGYVDFKIIKAAIYIILRVEFGFLLVVINGKLKPVDLYIEGSVRVSLEITIACFKIFRKRFCIRIHLSFETTIRFPFTIGKNESLIALGSTKRLTKKAEKIKVLFKETIPILYIPGISNSSEGGKQVIHHFAVNFFGYKFNGNGDLQFAKSNVLKDRIIKPIFDAILANGPRTYSEIRAIFLEGKEAIGIEFDVSSFKPTLLVGLTDMAGDPAFMKENFGFTPEEAANFKELIEKDVCLTGTGKDCPLRPIPLPISSTIKVKHKDGSQFETDQNGFNITLKNIFKDAVGNALDVNRSIKREEKYQQSHIDRIEKYFDGYMTQFLDRNATKQFSAETFDLREAAIIPEYFKLIGLLILEAYFNFLADQPEARENAEFDPPISLNELFSDQNGWSLNEQLEKRIIGQINYFYNNGLRLPDVLKTKPDTKSFYELLQQNDKVGGFIAPDINKADITITKADNSASFSLKGDMLIEGGLASLVETGEKLMNVNLEAVAREFTAAGPDMPYKLFNVRLPISNSNLNLQGTTEQTRFFGIPEKIHQHFKTNNVGLKLFRIHAETREETSMAFAPCATIEVKIRPHQVNGDTKMAELINVYISDLVLMHKVKEFGRLVTNISVFLKKEVGDKVDYVSLLKPGQEAKTRMVKTNLCPRTHPPVILETGGRKASETDERYVVTLPEKERFIRTLWEAVTTNNGGYYLVDSPDSDLFSNNMPVTEQNNKILEYTLVFSFEYDSAKPCPAFCNYLRIKDIDDLFKQLDKSESSLCADVFRVVTKAGVEVLVPVEEYHSKVPVHCVGFTIERQNPDSSLGHDNYLPLEFEIVGNPDITKEKVLPLMPTQQKDEKTKILIEDKLFYKHVTPLRKVGSLENIDRYTDIGKSFEFKFGIRDVFGFRAIELQNRSFMHKHVYFDKIIPIGSWPFIDLSFWFTRFKNDELLFELKVRAFHEVTSIDKEQIASFKENLNTIIAQLTDNRVSVSLNYTLVSQKPTLKEIFLDFLRHVLSNLNNPKIKEIIVPFKIALNPEFRQQLEPIITISRPNDPALFVSLQSDIWDKQTIKSISTRIVPSNPEETELRISDTQKVKRKDTLKPLNNKISSAKDGSKECPYILGLGLDNDGEKALYLLRKDYLLAIKPKESSPLNKDAYYAILPYSNTLWSGTYFPQIAGASERTFSGIDLDEGLSVILAKMDELLSADTINKLSLPTTDGRNFMEILIASKKKLVESELKSKTDNIDKEVQDQRELQTEFRSLLLRRLSYFYQFDGIINLTVEPQADISKRLAEYRISLAIDKVDNFHLESSKIDFQKSTKKWFILFDQITPTTDIELDLGTTKTKIKVTHLEYDIKPMDAGSEIERSSWIQLIEPLELTDSRITTIGKKWPSIRRIFPPRPVINDHRARQRLRTGNLVWTANTDLGQWQYQIEVKDPYENNDQLDFTIYFETFSPVRALAEIRNFKGFIAFWSSVIKASSQVNSGIVFNEIEFINHLAHQMTLEDIKSLNRTSADKIEPYRFMLIKKNGKWSPKDNSGKFKISTIEIPGKLTVILEGPGFDLFNVENRIKAISAEIQAQRNKRADNPKFHYTTEAVRTPTWAVPQLQFSAPIRLETGLTLQAIFEKLKSINLPYKSTAKFLLKTSDLVKNPNSTVPMIAVKQMEIEKNAKPTVVVDDIFGNGYENGFPAVSITVYNEGGAENDLPVFTAEAIFKVLPKKKRVSANQHRDESL